MSTGGSACHLSQTAVLEKGKGVFMWDVNGKKYYDFLRSFRVGPVFKHQQSLRYVCVPKKMPPGIGTF